MSDKLWSGRFSGNQSALFDAFNRSIDVDAFLVFADIQGTLAHIAGLVDAQVLTSQEGCQLNEALAHIEKQLTTGNLTIDAKTKDEDVHMWLECHLTERLGLLGKKVHTGRSRNDQVATAVKLWLKASLKGQRGEIIRLLKTLLVLAETFAGAPMPGYTHLQPAQPITLGFHLLTYVAMLERDIKKVDQLLEQVDMSPLGAGALAGTSFPINRLLVAEAMGFSGVSLHAMDAVSDRDYVVDYLHLSATVLLHLSRLAEELILWSTPRFGFIALSDQWTSGSSMMPNKKNPDACELIRGKAGIATGRLSGFMATLKGLPLAYNKDLQEDKRVLWQASEDLSLCLVAMREQLATATFHTEAMAHALDEGFVNATDVADWLVRKGLPFREAHSLSGQLVKVALSKGCSLEALDIRVIEQLLLPIFLEGEICDTESIQDHMQDFLTSIDMASCLARRCADGGTAPSEVYRMIGIYKKRLAI